MQVHTHTCFDFIKFYHIVVHRAKFVFFEDMRGRKRERKLFFFVFANNNIKRVTFVCKMKNFFSQNPLFFRCKNKQCSVYYHAYT